MPGTGVLNLIGEDGTVSEAAPLWQIEKDDNPAGGEVDTHPYGLTASPDGALLVADAGVNALISVNPASKQMTVVATFDPIEGVFPNPNYEGKNLRDAVPTGVTVADGTTYVAFLTGAPFIPGTAKVVSVADDGTIADYATGLTMLTDLRTGPDGNMYAVQFGIFGEQGPVPNSGAVIRVMEGDASEVVVPGLSFPTSIDFNSDGDAYVTVNGVGAPGSGQVVKFAGLTGMTGTPVTEMMAAMQAAAPAEGAAPAAGAEAGAGTTTTAEAAPVEAGAEMTATTEAAPTTADAMGEKPMVMASDQESDGTSVTVDSVNAAVDGWMVIHADKDGKPGPVFGETAVPAGATSNVVVMLDPALAADGQLWAMLHVDEGTMGTYEFPGPDAPVKDGDMIVMAPFMATMMRAQRLPRRNRPQTS